MCVCVDATYTPRVTSQQSGQSLRARFVCGVYMVFIFIGTHFDIDKLSRFIRGGAAEQHVWGAHNAFKYVCAASYLSNNIYWLQKTRFDYARATRDTNTEIEHRARARYRETCRRRYLLNVWMPTRSSII